MSIKKRCSIFFHASLILLTLGAFSTFSTAMDGKKEDLAIIGSGSAAFSAATYAASQGAKVTMIEEGTIGGTCVNVGCVPSKIFIRAGQIAHTQQEHPFRGIGKHNPTVNAQLLLEQQRHRVEELRSSKYESVLEHNPNITFVRGLARFKDKNTLQIEAPQTELRTIEAKKILIATGSTPHIPDIPGLKDTPYWTSTEALYSGKVPAHLLVLGGSYVAAELAQAFRHLGSDVTMLVRSTLLSKEDPELGQGLKEIFEGEGIHVLTHTLPKSISHIDGFFNLNLDGQVIKGDQLLVATGRYANTSKLGLKEIGITTDSLGTILVDDHMRTNIDSIYAAGDCTTQPQYVYVAAAAGTRAAMNILGRDAALDLSIVPAVVFTDPQVATVGLSVSQAEGLGFVVESRKLGLESVPRALANFDTRGFIKLVADKNSQRILGAQILAPEAGDVIQSVAIAMRSNMTIRDLASQLFPYLTMVEGLKLCAQTFYTDVKKLSCCSDTPPPDLKTTTQHDCCSNNDGSKM